MDQIDRRTDAELIEATRSDPEAFGAFYRRHLERIIAYFMARTRNPELSADLAAETFASALAGSASYREGSEPTIAWLYAIARNTLADSQRRGQVRDRARRKLRMRPVELCDGDIERINEIWSAAERRPLEALADLPPQIRDAVRARVIDERSYEEMAGELDCSPALVRKRVSRGLSQLRTQIKEAS
jgi:RNA polymerase sigma factor (sigma-70 family)